MNICALRAMVFCQSTIKLDPDRSMVAGVVLAADPAIDVGRADLAGKGAAYKQEIQSQTGIAWPSIVHVMPEGILRLFVCAERGFARPRRGRDPVPESVGNCQRARRRSKATPDGFAKKKRAAFGLSKAFRRNRSRRVFGGCARCENSATERRAA